MWSQYKALNTLNKNWESEGEVADSAVITGYFNTLFSIIDKTTRQKTIRDTDSISSVHQTT